MRKLCGLAVIFLFTTILYANDSDKSLSLEGDWGYSINIDNETIEITGDHITNNTDKKSGDLKIVFVLSKDKYSGGNLSGWPLGECSFDSLEPDYQYSNIKKQISFDKQPASGDYYVTILLMASKKGTYGITSYGNYDDKISFINTFETKIKSLQSQIEIDQSYMKTIPMYAGSADLNMTNLLAAQLFQSSMDSLDKQLEVTNLQYNQKNNPRPTTFVCYKDIPDKTVQSNQPVNNITYPMLPVLPIAPVIAPPLRNNNTSTYDSGYAMKLQRDLERAKHDVEFAQGQVNFEKNNNGTGLTANILLNQAKQHELECQQRLNQYNTR